MKYTNSTLNNVSTPAPQQSIRSRIGSSRFIQKWMDFVDGAHWHSVLLLFVMAILGCFAIIFAVALVSTALTDAPIPRWMYSHTSWAAFMIGLGVVAAYVVPLSVACKWSELSGNAIDRCRDVMYAHSYDSVPISREGWFNYLTSVGYSPATAATMTRHIDDIEAADYAMMFNH